MQVPKERKKRKITEEGALAVGGGSFSMSIGNILGKAAEGPAKAGTAETAPEQEARPDEESVEEIIKRIPKITLHRRTSGMGGKTVTVVTLSGGAAADPETLAKALRKGLGCGSRVDGGNILLQGDIQERARDWFTKKGARRVVLGN